MEQTAKYLPQAQPGLFEYLLVAHPDAAATEKIMSEKELFSESYGQKTNKKKPGITLANFMAREAMEETILRYTQRICAQHQSFEVALNNYSGFPPHTIYLRVQNPGPFKQLTKELKVVSNYVSSCSCPPVNLISHPYLSIASRLPETIYSKAIIGYSQKTFHEKFLVNELVLLRRSNQYDNYKAVHVFRLQPRQQECTANILYN